MKDMLEVLKRAKMKKIYPNHNAFKNLLTQIEAASNSLILDWDDGAGEEWAKLYSSKEGCVCMISAQIGVAFIRKSYRNKAVLGVLNSVLTIFTEDYSSVEWSIDLEALKTEVPEIYWHSSENAVHSSSFSLDDLYFATI